jgi:DNA-binding CsgD family transcriptional regulator
MGECKECGLICNSPDNMDLSTRETEILGLIAAGNDNLEIAELLYISINTVHTHRTNILKKIGGNNTADMVRYYYEMVQK